MALVAVGGCRLFADYDLSDPMGESQRVAGTVSDFLSGEPLDGVSVCVADGARCTETRDGGVYELEGPGVGEPGAFEFLREGHRPALHHAVPEADFQLDYQLIADVALGLLALPLDPPFDADGALIIVDLDTPSEGGDATLDPPDGHGLFYLTEEGTVSNEGPLFVMGGWHGMAEGDYTITVTHPTLECERTMGWPGAVLDEHVLQAVAGYISTAPPFRCR